MLRPLGRAQQLRGVPLASVDDVPPALAVGTPSRHHGLLGAVIRPEQLTDADVPNAPQFTGSAERSIRAGSDFGVWRRLRAAQKCDDGHGPTGGPNGSRYDIGSPVNPQLDPREPD
jgi:hypothetical protein